MEILESLQEIFPDMSTHNIIVNNMPTMKNSYCEKIIEMSQG